MTAMRGAMLHLTVISSSKLHCLTWKGPAAGPLVLSPQSGNPDGPRGGCTGLATGHYANMLSPARNVLFHARPVVDAVPLLGVPGARAVNPLAADVVRDNAVPAPLPRWVEAATSFLSASFPFLLFVRERACACFLFFGSRPPRFGFLTGNLINIVILSGSSRCRHIFEVLVDPRNLWAPRTQGHVFTKETYPATFAAAFLHFPPLKKNRVTHSIWDN